MNKKNLQRFIEADEGYMPEIYLDPLGYKTFGIGHLVKKTDPEWNLPTGTTITRKRIMECFKVDVDSCIGECEVLYGDYYYEWPEEVQEVLANMMFNLGRGGLSKFKKFKKYLESNMWAHAAKEGRDSLWYRQVTNRAERLMKRLEALNDGED